MLCCKCDGGHEKESMFAVLIGPLCKVSCPVLRDCGGRGIKEGGGEWCGDIRGGIIAGDGKVMFIPGDGIIPEGRYMSRVDSTNEWFRHQVHKTISCNAYRGRAL